MTAQILIVEDNADTRELLDFYFTNAGFAVSTAMDGGEGIYKANTRHPDIILTDLNMPNLSGIDLIKHLRAQAETVDTPILVFTAFGKEMTKEAIEAGANQAFNKPFDFDTLVDVVRDLLKNPIASL